MTLSAHSPCAQNYRLCHHHMSLAHKKLTYFLGFSSCPSPDHFLELMSMISLGHQRALVWFWILFSTSTRTHMYCSDSPHCRTVHSFQETPQFIGFFACFRKTFSECPCTHQHLSPISSAALISAPGSPPSSDSFCDLPPHLHGHSSYLWIHLNAAVPSISCRACWSTQFQVPAQILSL